jgi:hypothetical protein
MSQQCHAVDRGRFDRRNTGNSRHAVACRRHLAIDTHDLPWRGRRSLRLETADLDRRRRGDQQRGDHPRIQA